MADDEAAGPTDTVPPAESEVQETPAAAATEDEVTVGDESQPTSQLDNEQTPEPDTTAAPGSTGNDPLDFVKNLLKQIKDRLLSLIGRQPEPAEADEEAGLVEEPPGGLQVPPEIASNPMATISPEHVIKFPVKFRSADASAHIDISNWSDHQISFKIKCTTPSAYTVTPPIGLIDKDETITITTTLLAGEHKTVATDKFLVAVTQVQDKYKDRHDKLREMWSSVPKDPTKYMEVLLRTAIGPIEEPKAPPDEELQRNYFIRKTSKFGRVNEFLYRNEHLGAQLSTFIRLQIFLAIVTLCCAAAIICYYYLSTPLMWSYHN